MTSWQIALPSLLYVGLLFYMAWRVERRGTGYRPQAWVYSLSLAVYCTSWTFYGAVGRAANNGWDFLPIYLGPAVCLIFGHRLLKRIIRVSKRNNVTSIADFLSARYGKSQAIAVAVAVIATVGVVPYIALQLKALARGYEVITGSDAFTSTQLNFSIDAALVIAAAMAFFAVVFGTRHVDRSEHHQGLVLAIAFESMVKLLAFVAVGVFCLWALHGSPQLFSEAWAQADLPDPFATLDINANFITQTVLACLAMLCLPRQFHLGVVENRDEKHVDTARWLLPLYLCIICVFVFPITASGLMFSGAGADPETFVLTLPQQAGENWLTLLVLLGGFAAATGMIIVSTVALSTMISNDIVMPALLWANNKRFSQHSNINKRLANIRRTSIVALLLAAYAYYRGLAGNESLASIGLLSFAAVAQFAPGIIVGAFWREVTGKAVLWGMCAGAAVWAYTLLLPMLIQGGLVSDYLMQHHWPGFHPQALFGMSAYDPLTHGVIWSLGVNIGLIWLITQLSSRRVIERLQANAFIDEPNQAQPSELKLRGDISVRDLEALVSQFWDADSKPPRLSSAVGDRPLRATEKASPKMLSAAEADLASAIGSASARVVLRAALSGKDLEITDMAAVFEESSQALEFSREILQATMENIEQAVSVIDADLRLVAWNQRYKDLFQYPPALMRVGTPVAELIRFNAERGECGPGDVEAHIQKRLDHYKRGLGHSFERTRRDGRVLQMRGNPMPGGGFVTSFTDVSAYKLAQQALEEANTTLEQRVQTRTLAVESARQDAERANLSKTRFLAAASHDLLQPLNAARLFAAASQGEVATDTLHQNLAKIDQSLTSAEDLLSALLDVSKLDTGAWDVNRSHFPLAEIFDSLRREFEVIAATKQLSLSIRDSHLWAYGDATLIRRAIQNLVANAIRYSKENTPNGKVLVAARKRGNNIVVEVWDNGIGIANENLGRIFEEFQRLRAKQDSAGLGLGLSIVDRICRLCDFKITAQSQLHKGSRFQLSIPAGEASAGKTITPTEEAPTAKTKQSQTILCIDNEPDVLAGMQALLSRWGYNVMTASSEKEARAMPKPDCVLADYQLDNEQNGLDAVKALSLEWGTLPAVAIVTANHSAELKEEIAAAGYALFNKPLKPAALRAWLNAQFG